MLLPTISFAVIVQIFVVGVLIGFGLGVWVGISVFNQKRRNK